MESFLEIDWVKWLALALALFLLTTSIAMIAVTVGTIVEIFRGNKNDK